MSAALPGTAELTGAILSRRYRLGHLLGTGGMGSVYASTSPEDGRPLAIKLLGLEHLGDEDVKARFLEEGRTCQRLVHPNVVRVLEVGSAEDGTPYLVMERLDGATLSTYTRAGTRLPVAQAAAILQGVLAGLGAAHAQGIVHRDLKPENVLLARAADGAVTPKILDFGIAKVMDAAGGMGQRTRTGVLLGTPGYMSPEQIRNAKDVDPRADLWSAGVMLYELLTGRTAFPAPTEYARLNAVLSQTPVPVEQIDPALARLSAFLQLAMQKDRMQRFGSALDMARALAACAGTEAGERAPGTLANPGSPGALSRLPEVPSVLVPLSVPISLSPPSASRAGQGPNGTLASSNAGAVAIASAPAPAVVVVGSGGTLPSEHLPMLAAPGMTRRGVPPAVVAMLVAAALAAGFAMGLLLGSGR